MKLHINEVKKRIVEQKDVQKKIKEFLFKAKLLSFRQNEKNGYTHD